MVPLHIGISGHLNRTTEPATPIRVLVVDDHPLLREGLHDLVSSRRDFKIVGEAADGERACELAQLLQPHVILMDIEMPKMNGIDATRWIKILLPHINIIGLSINDSVTVRNDMKAAGATAYLTKDTTPEEFYQVILSTIRMETTQFPSPTAPC